MSNQGLNMVRKILRAAVAVMALAPIAAQANTLSFHFDTPDALLAPVDTMTVGGLANVATWSADAASMSTGSSTDNPILSVVGVDDGAGDGAFDRVGSLRALPSKGGLGSDTPGQVRSAGAAEPTTWLMLAVGLALLVGRRPSREHRLAAVA
jgi:MYXO-CTERM domain-containing protein